MEILRSTDADGKTINNTVSQLLFPHTIFYGVATIVSCNRPN